VLEVQLDSEGCAEVARNSDGQKCGCVSDLEKVQSELYVFYREGAQRPEKLHPMVQYLVESELNVKRSYPSTRNNIMPVPRAEAGTRST